MRRPHDAERTDLLAWGCEYCGAKPEDFCTRPNGEVAPWQHSTRYGELRTEHDRDYAELVEARRQEWDS